MSAPPTVTVRESGAPSGHQGGDRGPRIEVDPVGGNAYRIGVRGHTLLVDQPVGAGGEDQAPTPTELFVAALAGCVAFYAGRYLARHRLPSDGLRVTADYDMATDRPARVTAIRLRITLPDGLPGSRRAALHAVASHCTVHNSITSPPQVDIQLS